MRITRFAHRIVRLAIVAVALAASTGVSAQQAATYEVVSSFDIAFGIAPTSLRQADDGTFYGTTFGGGLFGGGTLFRMDETGVVTLLHSFSGPNDGSLPFGLVRASDGRFYGMTSGGGAFGFGTVFRFVPGGVVTTLHAFSETDSRFPVELFPASDGNVYGLTWGGGEFDNGTIFAIDPGGSFTTIHSIPLSVGGRMSSLVKGSDSRFYVTAQRGGDRGGGTLFAIDGDGTVTILYAFGGCGVREVPREPVGLIQARDGRLYGTTISGGTSNEGTLYSIDLAGNYSLLHSFSSTTDGGGPDRDLVEASDGNFYGVTHFPGKAFRVDPTGTVTPLQRLPGSSPGDLIQGADGRLYGTTECCGPRGGTIFTIDLQATTLATLHQFERWQTEWRHPGTQRPILWDNTGGGGGPRPGAHRDSVRDGCHGRTYHTAHVRKVCRWALRASSTAYRCRTCSKAPMEACTEPRLTSSTISFRRDRSTKSALQATSRGYRASTSCERE